MKYIKVTTFVLITIMGLNACEDKKRMTKNASTEQSTAKASSPTMRVTVGEKVYEFNTNVHYNCLVYDKKVMTRVIQNEHMQLAVEQRKEGKWLVDYREKIEGETTYTDYNGKEYKIDYDGKEIKGTAVMERSGKDDIRISFYIKCS